MPLDITFTLSDQDLDHFQGIVDKAKTVVEGGDTTASIEAAARQLIDEIIQFRTKNAIIISSRSSNPIAKKGEKLIESSTYKELKFEVPGMGLSLTPVLKFFRKYLFIAQPA